MPYKFFDKRFLVFPDEDCLGKKVFYADSYKNLIEEVESGDSGKTGTIDGVYKDEVYPFNIDSANWVLAYHDPSYPAKVAYSQGKKVQYKEADGEWVDVAPPHWVKGGEYRVKPDKYFVHYEADTDCYCYDTDNTISILYEGTEEECIAWMAEHESKTRRMTNRELAEWGASNKGQIRYLGHAHTTYYYLDGSDDETLDDCVKIRAWSESEWHEPLVEVTI